MKKLTGAALILAGLLAVSVVAISRLGGAKPLGPPRVEVDRLSQNWGRVLPGSESETTFTIRNGGGLPLHLGEITKSCGCTKPRLDRDTLPPGGSTTLAVGFQAPVNLGAAKNYVKIKTDDPERPELVLDLFAESWLGVTTIPQAIDAGSVKPGAEVRRDVQLRSPDGKPFRIGRASADIAELSVEAEDAADPLAVHRAVVVYRAGDRLGHVGGSIRFATDRADAPSVDVVFSGRVTGPVTASPSSLEITRGEIGQVVRRKIFLKARAGNAPILNEIKAIPPWELVGHEVQPRPDGLVIVEVSLRFPKGDGTPSGQLEMGVAAPEPIRLRIPLLIQGWTPPPPSP